MKTRFRVSLLPFLLLSLLFVLPACGGDDDSDDDDGDSRISSRAATRTAEARESGDGDGDSGSDDGDSGSDAEVRYLAMGDSLTQGIGSDNFETEAFPYRLTERWRDDGCEVELLNAGISGYTAEQILDEQAPNIESFQPTIITFQTGGNDIANGVTEDEYRENVRKVLDAAVGSGAKVYVFYQNEWERSPTGMGYTTADVREVYNDILEEEVEDAGAEMVDLRDLYEQQADDEMWVEDGLHPTAEAYDQWAERMAEEIGNPCD